MVVMLCTTYTFDFLVMSECPPHIYPDLEHPLLCNYMPLTKNNKYLNSILSQYAYMINSISAVLKGQIKNVAGDMFHTHI